MDTIRISIARILALDVPLTWQDAVAVVQEAAMLSDVNAAMNARPSLVSPGTCFITRSGDLELPVTTDVESPEAVSMLLREMLAGREAPAELETLAFGHAIRNVSGALEQFPIPNRRAEIARLASRAFALESNGARASALAAAAAAPAPRPSIVAPPPSPARAAVVAAAPALPVAAAHPRATPSNTATPEDPAAATNLITAELRRLRLKSLAASLARSRRGWRFGLHSVSPRARWIAGACVASTALASGVWLAVAASGTGKAAIATASLPVVPVMPFPRAVSQSSPAQLLAANASPVATGRPAPPRANGAPAAPRLTVAARGAPAATPARDSPVLPPLTASAPLATARTAPATLDAAAAARRRSAPTPARPAAPVPAVGDARGAVAAPSSGAGPPASAIPTRPPAADSHEEGVTLFSVDNAEVAPPVFRRQQVPSAMLEPGAEVPEGWPYLELIVDAQGAVENVRLRAKSPAPGQTLYRHRMLIAAAKAWQFEPARKDGKAVRYAIRVPLEP